MLRVKPTSVRFYSTAGEALKIKNPVMRDAVLQGKWAEGPPSLKTRRARLAYQSPEGLNEVFPLAYEIIQKESRRLQNVSDEFEKKASGVADDVRKKELLERSKTAAVRSQMHNPEILYNHKMQLDDFKLPVYRYLEQRDWSEYEKLLNIDRVENMHVIPDTLPTIDLRARVRMQFPGYANKWFAPGDILRNEVASKAPILEVQEFDEIADGSLYTVVIVDPDTPDLESDSYSTTLHWAVVNVPLSNVDNAINASKGEELVPYLPPHPEANIPAHRYVAWVFRQSKNPLEVRKIQVEKANLSRLDFDLASFAEQHGLDAVGVHFWRTKYDRSTDGVREKFGLGKGRVFSKIRSGEL